MKTRTFKSVCLFLALVLTCIQFPSYIAFAENTETTAPLVHYDFAGETLDAQLSNKGSDTATTSLKLNHTGGASYVSDGVAYVNEAKGNSLNATLGKGVKDASELTIFTVFKVEGDTPNQYTELVNIGNGMNSGNGLLRWKMTKHNQPKSSVTFFNQAFQDGNKSPEIPYGQWIYGAVTISYDATTKIATAIQYLSFDGGRTYEALETQTQTDVENGIATAGALTLGKLNATADNRGRSFYYEDFRIYGSAMSAEQLAAIQVEKSDSLESSLITHYDFSGSTEADQLRDKATAGASAENLTLKTTETDGTSDSYIKNGAAYVDRKNGNYLRVSTPTDIKNLEDGFTVFVEFRAEVEAVINWVEILHIPNAVRLLYHKDRTLKSKFGSSGDTVNNTATGALPSGMDGAWIRIAYTGSYDATTQNYTVTPYYSFDGGTTWTKGNATASKGGEGMFANASELILGKNNVNVDDRGISFLYNDVRIYDRSLTAEEIKSIVPTETVDLEKHLIAQYDFLGNTEGERLSSKKGAGQFTFSNPSGSSSVKEGVATISSTAKDYLYLDALSALKNSENSSMTVFTAVQLSGTATSGLANVLVLGNNLRLHINTNGNKIYTRIGTAATTSNATEYNYGSYAITRDAWVRIAVTIADNGNGSYLCTMYYSADNGATWNHFSHGFDGVTLNAENPYLILGKVNKTAGGSGYELRYDEVQIYNKALNFEEIKSITVESFEPVRNLGLQRAVGAESSKVRLVAEIDGCDYLSAGFKVTATWDEQTGTSAEVELVCNHAYVGLLAEDENGSIEEIAPSKAGKYLIAVIIENIPVSYTNVILTFTPYAISAEDHTTYLGESFVYNVSDGVYAEA